MVLAYAVIFLIALAVGLRRDFSKLGQIPYRGGWWLAAGVIGSFILQAVLVIYVPGQTIWQIIILNLAQIVLIFLFLLNHHVPGAKLFALGIALNVLVMVANGGWMPVTPEIYHFVHPDRSTVEQTRPSNSKNVILSRAETRLWILSDMIPLTLPGRRTAVSLGDVVLVAGVAQFIFQTTAKKKDKMAAGQI